jgi:predicted amidohydrolase
LFSARKCRYFIDIYNVKRQPPAQFLTGNSLLSITLFTYFKRLDFKCFYIILCKMNKTFRIALYQGYHGQNIPDEILAEIKEAKPGLLCLPEYLMVGADEPSILPSAERHDRYLSQFKDLSKRLRCAIAGPTLLRWTVSGYKNTSYLISEGKVSGFYDKIHPYKREGKGLVIPGYEYKVLELGGIRIGLLICADVLYKDTYANIYGLEPDIIVIHVTASLRKNETIKDKYDRDQMLFARGAIITGCPVIKVSSVGKIAGHPVQGRSMVVTPRGIIFRVAPEDELKPVLKIIDLNT